MAARLVAHSCSLTSMRTPGTPPRRLRLAAHVCACQSDGQVILLDLRRNKYIGVGGRHVAALAHAVDGWPASALDEDHPVVAPDIRTLMQPLLLQGLLTDRPVDRLVEKPFTSSIGEANASLDVEDAMEDATIGARRMVQMVRSAAAAAMWLRYRSLLSIAQTVAARRAQFEPGRICGSTSPNAMREAVAAYDKLRPLVFTARDRCLHDSLALVDFLAAEGMFPRWVIGVQTQPFGAHSWVQSGETVLNDHPDRVRRFRPILVV
jgi:hypothetical protein